MSAAPAISPLELRTMRKVAWRLLPVLMLGYFIAFVDRVNVGFAALQMNHAIGLNAAAFGLGGGLFYLTYVLFEIPSNLAMQRVGARLWIARIMVSWGLVSAGTAFIVGPNSFYAMRLLLGAAEAGFFPGVILYLTQWFPAAYRGRIIAVFMVAVPLSSFIGSPLSAALLQLDGLFGLQGWQAMFILEAVPAILLGLASPWLLTNRPQDARWLETEERAWLVGRLEDERRQAGPRASHAKLADVLLDRRVLAAALVYAGASGASQCLSLWQPQIIKSFGLTTTQTGLLNAVPFGVASIAMLWWGKRSDARNERVWHTGMPLALVAASLALVPLAQLSLPFTIALLIIAVACTYVFKGPFWALAADWMPGAAAAAGLAQVNAIGNLAGFVGSAMLGAIREATGSFALALLPIALISAAGCLTLWLVQRNR
ncbi:MFS transporter [Noviherbaspirillum sp. DKR-6]|uniref:MFS transporter n=2 Tax=Noviherbaspirillum pedocola TaxID=2801341 RepID=A0A934SYY5_9BURK|nr:MFS transporter [Noviherbaspirillum pedocola]